MLTPGMATFLNQEEGGWCTCTCTMILLGRNCSGLTLTRTCPRGRLALFVQVHLSQIAVWRYTMRGTTARTVGKASQSAIGATTRQALASLRTWAGLSMLEGMAIMTSAKYFCHLNSARAAVLRFTSRRPLLPLHVGSVACSPVVENVAATNTRNSLKSNSLARRVPMLLMNP